jgi:hypothetical protein
MGDSAIRLGLYCLVASGRPGRTVVESSGAIIDSSVIEGSVIESSVIDRSGTVGAHAGAVVWLDFPRREDADNDVANRHSRAC